MGEGREVEREVSRAAPPPQAGRREAPEERAVAGAEGAAWGDGAAQEDDEAMAAAHEGMDARERAATVKMLRKAMAHQNGDGRRWLLAGSADSYGGAHNRATLWVLQGSPPRGFIVSTPGKAVRLDMDGKRLRKFFEPW